MLHLFAGHMDRWKTLSLEAGATLATHLVFLVRGAVDDMPPLTALEIELESEQIPQAIVEELASQIASLQYLRKLYWMNWRYGFNLPNLPWEQYDDIMIHSRFAVEESIIFLSRCTSATSVALRGFRKPEYYSTPFNRPHTTLHHLTALTLDKSSDPLAALSHFTLPSLRFLEIGLHGRDFECLEKFLWRSQCPLRELVVIDLNLLADDIAAFFRFSWLTPIPNVKLGPTHDDAKMLGFMKQFEKAGVLLPDLFVWLEPVVDWPLLVGWMERGIQETYFSYENGKLIAPMVF
ncbi:hypothetical protein CVT26_008620 [Gymnopilus dilepis]|uniref:F-box domain-containing protein n=1 Tax=Gymnopilus dilepis TaxID=231916 RepID=A0A409XXZ6_9AGAR|nr:hypothetical protein CVT26_008620 [Gymnopilus dilepis]